MLFLLFPVLYVHSKTNDLNDLIVLKKSEVVILYEKPLDNVVNKVADIFPLIKTDLEKKLGQNIDFVPTILLVNRSSVFRNMVNNAFVTAFAVPSQKLIVIDYSKMEKTPFNLELTMKHELCHLLLHKYIQNSLLPKWFDEGISQWVSGGTADIINPDGKHYLKQAVLSGNFLPLKDISVHFPNTQKYLVLSYEQSKSIVEYIDSKYGKDNLLFILDRLHRGIDIDSAILDVLSVDISQMEKDWHKHLRRKYTWTIYLSDNIYWIIFFIGAVATVIGFLQLRKKIKNYTDDDNEDEFTE